MLRYWWTLKAQLIHAYLWLTSTAFEVISHSSDGPTILNFLSSAFKNGIPYCL